MKFSREFARIYIPREIQIIRVAQKLKCAKGKNKFHAQKEDCAIFLSLQGR